MTSSRAAADAADKEFRKTLLSAVPELKSFAIALAHNRDLADDLVQETLTKALEHADSFTRGSNMRAWLVTILRNQYFSERRRLRREIGDPEGIYQSGLVSLPEQEASILFKTVVSAVGELPSPMRETLVAVGAEAYTYEEAAQFCGCAIGTIKSRASRARAMLRRKAKFPGHREWASDPVMLAALAASATTAA